VTFKILRSNWVKVLIYLKKDGVCSGYMYCPNRRLLDSLNHISPESIRDGYHSKFLQVKKARIDCLATREVAETANIRISDILFIRPIEPETIPGMPGQSRRILLYLQSHVLTGQVHFNRGMHWRSVIESTLHFFPITSAEINLRISKTRYKTPFVVVNKKNVSFAEE